MLGSLRKTLLSISFAMSLMVLASPQVTEPESLLNSEWNIYTVDSEGQVGSHNSLALDGDNNPHISYYDSTNRRLKYAKWTGIGWSNETLDSIPVAYWQDLQPSIALDNNDNPRISYSGSYNKDLRYAEWNGTAWNTEIVHLAGYVVVSNSLALDSNHQPHISYYNGTDQDLKYAAKGELGETKRSISLDIDPDTLNLRSNGKWITAYLTTENACADDIDASSLLLNDVITPAWWDVQNDTTSMVKFERAAVQAIVPISDSVDIKVTGQWMEGERFEVHDTIRVINPGR